MACFFCSSDLDNSDEHIILDCLNGKLHSRRIICSKCNNFFGAQLDNVAKTFFNPVLLVLGFKNAASSIAENLSGDDDFLYKNDGKIIYRKPRVFERKINGKTLLSIIGDKKNALKYFERYAKKLKDKGFKVIATEGRENIHNEPVRIKTEFKTNPQINLLLNKMAIEYCAYNQIITPSINNLASRVRKLDDKLDNVFYCNLDEEFREFSSGEITHLIKLWSDNAKIYAYIELFNILCSVILIADDYEGENFDFQYYQDCISGEKLNTVVEINKPQVEVIFKKNDSRIDFSILVNKLFYRKRQKDFSQNFKIGLNEISDRLNEQLLCKAITKEEFAETFIQQSTEFTARLTIDNPYLLDDVDDVNNDELNYIHSNLRFNQFDEFIKKHSQLIGREVKVDGQKFIVEKFDKIPIAKQNGIEIINVRVVLYNGMNRRYIPYKAFFDQIDFYKYIFGQ